MNWRLEGYLTLWMLTRDGWLRGMSRGKNSLYIKCASHLTLSYSICEMSLFDLIADGVVTTGGNHCDEMGRIINRFNCDASHSAQTTWCWIHDREMAMFLRSSFIYFPVYVYFFNLILLLSLTFNLTRRGGSTLWLDNFPIIHSSWDGQRRVQSKLYSNSH